MWTNGSLTPQKRTFARRQWAQYLLFFVFLSTSFTINWLLLFVVNQLFSQKWSSKLSKAAFCSKTMGTIFAIFVLHSTSFPINLIIILWCQSIIFSKMKPETLKSKLLLEDSGHSICCFLFFFQHFSQSIWLLLFFVNQFFCQKWSLKFSYTFAEKTCALDFLNILKEKCGANIIDGGIKRKSFV